MLTLQQLKKMSTQRLVAFKKKYYPREGCAWDSANEYNEGHALMKEILSTRGHVVRKSEKKRKK